MNRPYRTREESARRARKRKPAPKMGTKATKATNPAIQHVLQFFSWQHLPPALQEVSKPFCNLAYTVAASGDNPEVTVALRKLLEAKDAAVRANVGKGSTASNLAK